MQIQTVHVRSFKYITVLLLYVDNSILKNLSLNVSFYVMSNGTEATYLIDRFNYFEKIPVNINKATVMIMRYNSRKEL